MPDSHQPGLSQLEVGYDLIGSVRFGSDSHELRSTWMGGMDLKVWQLSHAVDDTTGDILNGKLTRDGMITELEGLEECHAGDCYTVEGFEKLKRDSGMAIRLIPTRWVTTAKGEGVRSRSVVNLPGASKASLGCADRQLQAHQPLLNAPLAKPHADDLCWAVLPELGGVSTSFMRDPSSFHYR